MEGGTLDEFIVGRTSVMEFLMPKITVAKALRTRKQLTGQVAELAARARNCVAQQEGASQDFQFISVNAERKAKIDQLVLIKTAIARANVVSVVSWKGSAISVAHAIRCQEELKGEIAFIGALSLQNGPQRVPTGDYDERRQPVYTTVSWKSAYTEPERVKLLAELRADCEGLNELLEEANHRNLVDLADSPP